MERNQSNTPYSQNKYAGKHFQMLMEKFPVDEEILKSMSTMELMSFIVNTSKLVSEVCFVLGDRMRINKENLEKEKNAREMAEKEVMKLTRTTNKLKAEAAKLRKTVSALTLEKAELLGVAEKSKAEACAEAVEAYKASQTYELQAETTELRNTVTASTLKMKELLVFAEKSKAEAGALAIEAYKASKTNELQAEAAELRNTVASLTLERKELLVQAEKSKAEAGAQAIEAYKASQTGFHRDASEFSVQVCKGFWDYFIKEVLRVHPDLDLSGVVNPLDAITAVHSLLLLGRD